MVVGAVDRRWLLKDITNREEREGAYGLDSDSEKVRKSGRADLRVRLEVSD